MSGRIVIRSRRQSYVIFACFLGSVIIFTAYVAIHTGVNDLLEGSFFMGALLSFMWWYLSTFKLILTEHAIVYKELWRSTETPIAMVRSIKHGQLFGISPIWVIQRTDHTTTLIKVANFSPGELRGFAQALIEQNPGIEFTALPLRR